MIAPTPDAATAATTWLTVYQPLIVGLGAVVLGLMGNTVLEWLKQYWTAERQIRAMRLHLREELFVSQRAFEGAEDTLAEWEPGTDVEIPIVERYPAYAHHLPNVGLMDRQCVKAVVEAYSHLEATLEWMKVVAVLDRVEGRLFARVNHDRRELLQRFVQSQLQFVRAATAALG
jgi:hypothetical protein